MSHGLEDNLGTKSKLKEKISKLLHKYKTILIILIVFLFIVIFFLGQINGANNSLFVTSMNGEPDDKLVGSEVIEVAVVDIDISDTQSSQGEPDVTVNGKKLRMAQGPDGNWYGYFADRDMAQIADSIVAGNTPGKGQDYGYFCNNQITIVDEDSTSVEVDFSETEGVIIDEVVGGAVDGSSTGGPITADCGTKIMGTDSNYNNILIPKGLSGINEFLPSGQIGVSRNLWPLIQLYNFNPDGNIVVQYNKGGGVQTTTLTFVTVDQYADVKKYELRLKAGSFIPVEGFQKNEIIASRNSTETENFFFLQTTQFLDSAKIESLKGQGITLLDYLDGFVYVASANDISLNNFSFNSPEFRAAVPIYGKYKLDPVLGCYDRPDIFDVKFIGDPFHIPIPIRNDLPLIFDGGNTSGISVSDTSGILGTDTSGIPVTVIYHKQLSEGKMTQIISNHNGTPNGTIEAIKAVEANMTCDQIINLSKFSAIQFITRQDPPLEPEIIKAKEAAHVTEINNMPDTNLTGKGVVALVFDETKIVDHPDLIPRVKDLDSGSTGRSAHSVHVAGIIGAGGTDSPGIAPEIEIYSWGSIKASASTHGWNDDLASDTLDLESAFERANSKSNEERGKGIDLMNISMGNYVNFNEISCDKLGDYTTTSYLLDEFVKGGVFIDNEGNKKVYPPTTITQSAGNERNPADKQCDGDSGIQYGTVNSPATAKNPIVVGAILSDDVNENYLHSSYGPTDDKRTKPDLVAPGAHSNSEGIISTSIITMGDNYTPHHEAMKGTSMSAAFVAGLVALIDQHWNEINPENHLLPHTVKAILIHTADDLGGKVPSNKYGWGLVNGKKAINLITESKFVNATIPGVKKEITKFPTIIYDSVNDKNIKKNEYLIKIDKLKSLNVTLVWDDPLLPLILSEDVPELLHDLDLKVIEENKVTFPKTITEPGKNEGVIEGIDDRNNVEVIRIPPINDLENEITVEVFAKQLKTTNPSQDYTLIVSGTSEKQESIVIEPPAPEEISLKIDEDEFSPDSIKITGSTSSKNIIQVKVIPPIGDTFFSDSISPSLIGDSPPKFKDEININNENWIVDGNYKIIFSQQGNDGHLNEASIIVEIKNGVHVPEFGTLGVMILLASIIFVIIISTKLRPEIIRRH